jgi:hypothetical protein
MSLDLVVLTPGGVRCAVHGDRVAATTRHQPLQGLPPHQQHQRVPLADTEVVETRRDADVRDVLPAGHVVRDLDLEVAARGRLTGQQADAREWRRDALLREAFAEELRDLLRPTQERVHLEDRRVWVVVHLRRAPPTVGPAGVRPHVHVSQRRRHLPIMAAPAAASTRPTGVL